MVTQFMPTIDNKKPSSLLFKIELVILLIILGGVALLGWRLAPEDVKAQLSNIPVQIISTIKTRIENNNQQSTAQLAELNETPEPTHTPKPTIIPLPEGSQTYNFSVGKDVVGPKISKLTIDPLTPQVANNQVVTLSASHTSRISSVTIEVITDNKSSRHTLTQKSGTDLEGTWEGSWTIDDAYDYNYGLRLILSSNQGTYDNTMWFRSL